MALNPLPPNLEALLGLIQVVFGDDQRLNKSDSLSWLFSGFDIFHQYLKA
jgi:hypothetical protein